MKLTGVLGLIVDKKEEILDEDIEKLIEERQAARKAKDFARADAIRDELLEKGYHLKGYQRRSTMEKSVEWEFDTYMQEIFQMKEVDIKEYSPLTLAYIGDCIYDLIIKTLVINEGNTSGTETAPEDQLLCTGIRTVENDAYDAETSDRRKACHL